MALARVTTWNPGDTLKAADLNGEFNNLLNNPITLISPTTGAINFQTSIAHSNLTPSVISGTSGGALPAAISHVRGLLGTVSTQTAVMSADQYLLQTTAASPLYMTLNSTATFTVNAGTAGPIVNGRDVSATFSSTFLHLYAITTGAGSTTPAGILSTTPPPTGPLLPTTAGYSAWGYLGTYQYSSASTTFANPQRPRGATVFYESRQQAVGGGAATSETSVSVASLVPSNALSYSMEFTVSGGSAHRLRLVSGSDFWADTMSTTVVTWEATFPNIGQSYFYIFDAAGGNSNQLIHYYRVANGGE